jgi:hypothetical protein
MRRWLEWALLCVAIVLVAASACRWFYATNEDAWISLKYARNLADGFGLVSNPGGLHEEGYSDFSWVLILAAARRFFGADLLLTAKVLGILCLVATGLVARAIFRRLTKLPGDARVVVAAAGSSFAAFWATQGLETSLYSLEIVLLVYLFLRVVDGGGRAALIALSLLCWVGWITRPEGAMNFVIVFGCLGLWALLARPGRDTLIDLLGALLLGVALVGLTLSWKLRYFGDTLANPSYIKLGIRRYAQFAPYALDYLRAKGVIFTLLLVAAAATVWWRGDRRLRLVALFLSLLLLSQIAFVAWVGNDYQLYARFFVTHYAAAVLLIVLAARRHLFVYLLAALALIHSSWREPVAGEWWWRAGFPSPATALDDNAYGRGARRLSELMKDGGKYALSEYGYIPFHAGGEGVDMMGLNSRRVARNFKYYPFEEVFYASRDHVLAELPKVIITGGVYRLGPSPSPSPRFEIPTACDGEGCRTPDLLATPGASWFFAPYLESPYFRNHYTLDVPSDRADWEWTFFMQRAPLTLTNELDAQHPDQLLHGFHEDKGELWAAPISRALVAPRAGDHEVCVDGIGDVTLRLCLDADAVGDRVVRTVRAGFTCIPIPSQEPFLLTLRATAPFRLRRILTR